MSEAMSERGKDTEEITVMNDDSKPSRDTQKEPLRENGSWMVDWIVAEGTSLL